MLMLKDFGFNRSVSTQRHLLSFDDTYTPLYSDLLTAINNHQDEELLSHLSASRSCLC
jgi:hypothetical protein